MTRDRRLDPSTDPAEAAGTQAVAGSISARVRGAVLGNLLRVVRFFSRALDGFSPNL